MTAFISFILYHLPLKVFKKLKVDVQVWTMLCQNSNNLICFFQEGILDSMGLFFSYVMYLFNQNYVDFATNAFFIII